MSSLGTMAIVRLAMLRGLCWRNFEAGEFARLAEEFSRYIAGGIRVLDWSPTGGRGSRLPVEVES